MKITGLIFIILGSLLILSDLMAYSNPGRVRPNAETVNLVAYYIGFNSGFILGGLFLPTGIWLLKKAKNRKLKKDLLKGFLEETMQEKKP